MVNAVDKANGRRLERILFGQRHMDLPHPTFVRSCAQTNKISASASFDLQSVATARRTVFRAVELDVEVAGLGLVGQLHVVVAHHAVKTRHVRSLECTGDSSRAYVQLHHVRLASLVHGAHLDSAADGLQMDEWGS